MKLASLKGGRDGRLCVLSQDLRLAVLVKEFRHLQAALDNWFESEPILNQYYADLNANRAREAFAFDQTFFASPLPRAYQWIDGSAYVNHIELVRKARGVEMPPDFWTDPLMYQGGSDDFLAPNQAICLRDPAEGLDFEAEIGVIVDDVPMGISSSDALKKIRLLVLINDITCRNLIAAELAKGFGFFQSKPSSAFAPIALTPDELGDAWDGRKCHLPIYSFLNGVLFGKPNAGVDMTFDFGTLIAHAAKTRALSAGTIIGSGTVSNYDRTLGSSCIAERRCLEFLDSGTIQTPFLQIGDKIEIAVYDKQGLSVFGAIHQTVVGEI